MTINLGRICNIRTILLIAAIIGSVYAHHANGAVAFSSATAIASPPGGHKGIRSYDGSVDSNQPGNGRKGCPKCKWEDDDYWEQEEQETEPEERNEDECDDGDDGQYREYGRKSGSPGIHKVGGPGYPSSAPGSSPGAGSNVGSSATSPVKQGYLGAGGPAGSPWNKATFGQPGSNSGTPKASWNQGGPGSPPQIGQWNPSGSTHAGKQPGSWNDKLDSGCSGSYQPGSGCGQGPGTSGAGPLKQAPVPFGSGGTANVQKQAPLDYSTGPSGYGPQGSGCNGPYGNCGNTQQGGPTSGPGHHPSSGFPQGTPGSPKYPGVPGGSGGHGGPGSPGGPGGPGAPGGPGYPGGHGGSGGSGSAGYPGGPGYPGASRRPGRAGYPVASGRAGGPANAFSSSTAFAGAGPANHPAPIGSFPSGSNDLKQPYSGTKRGSGSTPNAYGNKPYPGDDKPSSASGPLRGNTFGTGRPGRPTSRKDDSNIFYIDVKPAPGSPVEVKRPTGKHAPSYGPGTKPAPYADSGVTSQPLSYGAPDATKPGYQPSLGGAPAPFGGSGTTRSPFSGPAVSPGANYPVNQAPSGPAGGCAGQNCGGGGGCNNQNCGGGCSGGKQGCGGGCGGGSPGRKPCDQQGAVGVDKTIGPVGGFSSPNDYSQSSQSVFPGGSVQTSTGNSVAGCQQGSCAHGAEGPYVNKVENDNKAGYPWNPFLNGKVPSLNIGGLSVSTTSKPIGLGNLFLSGPSGPGAGSWGAGAVSTSSTGSSGGSPLKPVGKDNPFLAGGGPTRGDIGISDSSGSPGGSYSPASNAGTKSPSAINRGVGSGGGLSGDLANLPGQLGAHNAGFGGAFSGAVASSFANTGAGAGAGAVPGLGQANSGSWAFSGAESQAGNGAWSSSGASAYASSSANSWAGPVGVKG